MTAEIVGFWRLPEDSIWDMGTPFHFQSYLWNLEGVTPTFSHTHFIGPGGLNSSQGRGAALV